MLRTILNPTSCLALTRSNNVTLPDSLKSELQSGLSQCYLSIFEHPGKLSDHHNIASALSEYLIQFIEDNNFTRYNLSTEVEVTSLLKDDILNLDITLPEWVITGVLQYKFCFK